MTAPQILQPPYAGVLGLTTTPGEGGRPVLAMPFSPDLVGRPGMLQGGAIAGLLEVAALAALDEALGPTPDPARGAAPEPLTATVDFLRGGHERTTHAAAEVVRLGRRIAVLTAAAWQDDRAAPIATARLTFRLAGCDRAASDQAPIDQLASSSAAAAVRAR